MNNLTDPSNTHLGMFFSHTIRAMALIAFTWAFVQVAGQSVGEMRAEFQDVSNTEDRIVAALKLSRSYMHTEKDSALYFLDAADLLAADASLDSLQVMVLMAKAKQLSLDARFEDAILSLREAHEVGVEGNLSGYTAQYFNLMGRYFRYAGQYDSSLFYTRSYDELLIDWNRQGDRYLPQLDLAKLYYNLGDSEKADEHMRQAVVFARVDKKPMNYLYTLLEAMQQYEKMGDLNTVSDLREEYLQFKLEQGTDVLLDARHGHMRSPNQNLEEQERIMLSYLPIHEDSKNWLSLANASYSLGNVYMQKGNTSEAVKMYAKGLMAADSVGLPAMQLNLNLGLYQALEVQGEFEQALGHLKVVYDLRESIRDVERQTLLNDLNVKYEIEQKDHQLQVAELELNSADQRQRGFLIGIIALAVILGLILYTLYVKQRSNRELEEKNKIISKALGEKDILLREIHHRVKNNLQMISALLYLQGKSIDDPSAQDAIRESRDRVQSMAMIHQNLYQDEDLLGIEVKDYLDKLFDHLFASYNINNEAVRLNKHIDTLSLDVDTVIPLALIVNELISNALKYAFKDDEQGQIDVVLQQDQDQLTLEVRDNGGGLGADFDPLTSGNFGFKLIRILSDQLGAEWDILADQGTCIRLTMKNKAAA